MAQHVLETEARNFWWGVVNKANILLKDELDRKTAKSVFNIPGRATSLSDLKTFKSISEKYQRNIIKRGVPAMQYPPKMKFPRTLLIEEDGTVHDTSPLAEDLNLSEESENEADNASVMSGSSGDSELNHMEKEILTKITASEAEARDSPFHMPDLSDLVEDPSLTPSRPEPDDEICAKIRQLEEEKMKLLSSINQQSATHVVAEPSRSQTIAAGRYPVLPGTSGQEKDGRNKGECSRKIADADGPRNGAKPNAVFCPPSKPSRASMPSTSEDVRRLTASIDPVKQILSNYPSEVKDILLNDIIPHLPQSDNEISEILSKILRHLIIHLRIGKKTSELAVYVTRLETHERDFQKLEEIRAHSKRSAEILSKIEEHCAIEKERIEGMRKLKSTIESLHGLPEAKCNGACDLCCTLQALNAEISKTAKRAHPKSEKKLDVKRKRYAKTSARE